MAQVIDVMQLRPKYIAIQDLQNYLSVGRDTAREIGVLSGAKMKVGKKYIYELKKIDAYMENLREEQNYIEMA